MVSSGRSRRLRVGLERSGSAGTVLGLARSLCKQSSMEDVLMTFPSRSRCCMLRRENVSWPGWLVTATMEVRKGTTRSRSDGNLLGCSSYSAKLGSALVCNEVFGLSCDPREPVRSLDEREEGILGACVAKKVSEGRNSRVWSPLLKYRGTIKNISYKWDGL